MPPVPVLSGLAIQWGAVGDVGVVHDIMDAAAVAGAFAAQRIASCMALMDSFLSQKHPVVSSFVKDDSSPSVGDKDKPDLVRSAAHVLGESRRPYSCRSSVTAFFVV